MIYYFENTESWEDMSKSQAISSWHCPHFIFAPLFFAFTINKLHSLPLWKFHTSPLWNNAW